ALAGAAVADPAVAGDSAGVDQHRHGRIGGEAGLWRAAQCHAHRRHRAHRGRRRAGGGMGVNRARFFVIGFVMLALVDKLKQVSFKFATQRTGEFAFALPWLRAAALSPWIYVAIAGYLGAFVAWMTLLE